MNIVYKHIRLALMSVVVLAAAALLFVQSTKAQVPSGSNCVNVYQAGMAVPAGFAVPYNVFSVEQEMLVSVGACALDGVNLYVGNGAQNTYVWDEGYTWDGSSWHLFTYAQTPNSNDGWLVGQGDAYFRRTGNIQYVVGYTCQYINQNWRCGCSDTTCATSNWHLQGIQTQ